MYDHVVATIGAVLANLPVGYTSHEVAGLLDVQGEGNDLVEADEAGIRFDALVADLRSDLANASAMKGVFGEIGGGSTVERDLTRVRHSGLAVASPDRGYAAALGLSEHNGLNHNADSMLLLGEQMAAEVIDTGCFPTEPFPAWDDLYAWFVADGGVQGGPVVDRWADLAGGMGVRDLTRAVSARPESRLVTAAGEVRRILEFNTGTDLWASSGEFGEITDPRTVAVLCRVKSGNSGYLFDGSTFSGRSRAHVRDGDWQVGVANNWDGPEGVTTSAVAEIWQRHVWRFDEIGGVTEITHWIDGVVAGTNTNTGSLNGFIIGSNGGVPFRHLAVDVVEVVVFDKAPDGTEVAELDAAWAARWGTIAGPPFAVSVSQGDVKVSRFG